MRTLVSGFNKSLQAAHLTGAPHRGSLECVQLKWLGGLLGGRGRKLCESPPWTSLCHQRFSTVTAWEGVPLESGGWRVGMLLRVTGCTRQST